MNTRRPVITPTEEWMTSLPFDFSKVSIFLRKKFPHIAFPELGAWNSGRAKTKIYYVPWILVWGRPVDSRPPKSSFVYRPRFISAIAINAGYTRPNDEIYYLWVRGRYVCPRSEAKCERIRSNSTLCGVILCIDSIFGNTGLLFDGGVV